MLGKWVRGAMIAFAGGLALAMASCATSPERTATPSVEAVPGQALLTMGLYDLATLGYRQDEFFISGTANSYQRAGDGSVQTATASPYATRIVVTRPIDANHFNGSVIVEWLNVSGGQDAPADWLIAHREFARSGFAHVSVSAQRVGVEGGQSLIGAGASLKQANPERYGRLTHPGDAFSFDIFSQAGRAIREDSAIVLSGLRPQRLIAAGESQSAMFLTTYVNAVDPSARVYDGFLIHSRFGGGAALDGSPTRGPGSAPPTPAPFRPDLRVPVMGVMTETDIVDGNLLGYSRARVPDNERLRVWELAGSAHADNYLFGVGMQDNGTLSAAQLAQGFAPSRQSAAGELDRPANPGQVHHYVVQAAFAQIDRWLRTGQAPPQASPLVLADPPTSFVLDENGIARGGVRTPWADVPTVRLSGIGNSGGLVGFLAGVGDPYDAATLARLYPGGQADYLRRFEASLDEAIQSGFILAADRQEILEVAAALYPDAP